MKPLADTVAGGGRLVLLAPRGSLCLLWEYLFLIVCSGLAALLQIRPICTVKVTECTASGEDFAMAQGITASR